MNTPILLFRRTFPLLAGMFFVFGSQARSEQVPKSATEQVEIYRKAAEQGDAKAQYSLGKCFAFGEGAPQDETEAAKWYLKAAAQGDSAAQSEIGFYYVNGRGGLPVDAVEGVKWYRKAAEQGSSYAQLQLGRIYLNGEGQPQDLVEAVKWYRLAAEQNESYAQLQLGEIYDDLGVDTDKNAVEAVRWYRKVAEQGDAVGQRKLGLCYRLGKGATKDLVDAAKWFRKAADQGDAAAQFNLGICYAGGDGVVKDEVGAYKWWLLAAGQGYKDAKTNAEVLERQLARDQIAEGQRLARKFRPRKAPDAGEHLSSDQVADSHPAGSGTGFFITEDGFLITNHHVVKSANQVRLATSAGLIAAKVVKFDAVNDLALLKAEGKFLALPVTTSRSVRLGNSVATVGFPNIGLQGRAPKLAKGEIAGLSGAADDARYFQISVPLQPGNSGGALVDQRGNVVGVVAGKLNVAAALSAGGELPENVNYAVKSSFLLGFLESVPDVANSLKEPNSKEEKFENVVRAAEQAAVLVLAY